MLKNTLLTLSGVAAMIVLSAAFAQPNTNQPVAPSPNKVTIPVTKTPATSGKQMFDSYCAPCHGTDGKGQGPAASALRNPPTDLTLLAKNNGGKFPSTHIVTVLQFGSELPAHGSQQMPVWGPILSRMNQSSNQDKQLRISNLSRYLETIQQK